MRGKTKRLAILAVLVVVLLALCLTKCPDVELGFAGNDGNESALMLSNFTHLSTYLSGCEYQLCIEDIYLVGFVLLLTSWRSLLLRRMSE